MSYATKSPTSGLPHFKRMYVSIGTLKKGFLARCRKIIWLDGNFLKGVFGKANAKCYGRNGNDNIYPIAWAMVKLENKDSWI